MHRRLLGEGPQVAARQAAGLFALSGVLALVAVPSDRAHAGTLLLVAALDVAVAAVAWVLPWQRWPERATATLAVPAFAVLALATWVFGGFAAGTGPFFVLVFAWLGLHHPAWVIWSAVPFAVAGYVMPLVATGGSTRLVVSAVVLVPICVGIALLLSAQMGRLRAMRAEVEEANRWRAALMATLAHDVRSPLTMIRGVLELIGSYDDLPAERRDALLSAATAQVQRLGLLATGLLDLERVEQGKLRLDLEDVSVRHALVSAAELAGVEAQIDADPALVVRADAARLEQILVNLTANALRHGEPPIELSAAADGESVVIAVRDHGPGVPAADRPRLFERLSSADRDPGSVGLGLWIARLLAEAHGGRLDHEPASPGARFVVRLARSGAAGARVDPSRARMP